MRNIKKAIVSVYSLFLFAVLIMRDLFVFSDSEIDLAAIKKDFEIDEVSDALLDNDGVTTKGKAGYDEHGVKIGDKPAENKDQKPEDKSKDKPAKEPADKPAAKKDEKPADDKNKDNKDEKPEEKPYKVGAKGYTKEEILPLVTKEFEGIIDLNTVSDAQKEIFIQKYIDIEFGRNRDEWMKEQGRKDQKLADVKKDLEVKMAEYEGKVKDLVNRENELKAILDQKPASLDDEDKRIDLKLEQKEAKKELEQIEADKAIAVHHIRNNYFEQRVLDIGDICPELKMSGDYIEIMKEYKENKRKDDDPDVKKGFVLLDIINKAMLEDMDPVEYFKQYRFNYEHLEFFKSGSEKTQAEKDLERKLERNKDNKPGKDTEPGQKRNTDPADLIQGTTREEKLKNLQA